MSPGLVPAVTLPSTIIQAAGVKKEPVVSFSFDKSFKTVKEHMLLSLIAFEAPVSCFYSPEPDVPATQGPSPDMLLPGKPAQSPKLVKNVYL